MKKSAGKNMKKIIKTLALTALSFSLFSCQIGLGEEVDIIAPTLEVLTPERNSSVPQTVTVSGKAQDNTGVTLIEITFEKEGAEPHNYRYFEKTWQHKVNENWVEAAIGTITGPETNFTWEAKIPVSDANTGDSYTITTKIYDKNRNEGSTSKDERKVLIDVKEPLVSINKPTVEKDYIKASAKMAAYELCNNSDLPNLINQDIEISGYQKEDAQLDYLLVYLDKETTSDLPSLDQPVTEYLFKKELTGSQLKNWTVTIPQSELSEYQTGKNLFRLVTESHDKAGNVERKVQGWFTYWNDADAPWVYADFGNTKENFDALINAGKIEEANIYPGCSLQGQAFDDDGLAFVTVTTYKLSEGNWVKVKSETKDLSTENYPKYYAWTAYALAETCQFYVEASCIDVNGVESVSSIKRYMNVSDVNPPKITVTTSTQTSLFGDSNGNFKIEGNVIDDDVDNIPQLVLVWIKNAENQKKYVNTEYSGWKEDISATTGDLRFEITLPERDINKTQYYGEFSQELNIFTDLNIGIEEGKNSLNTQVFALMAKDSGGQTATTFLSFAGDYEKPKLTIDSITVDGGASIKFNETKLLPPFKRNADGNIASKVKLSGTWKDDSTDNWEDKTKIGKVTLSWTGLTTPITVTMNPDGSWETDDIIPPDSSTASITATLKDIGNNTATTNECFNININKPELVRLSAKTANGNYKAGNEIELTMEFNKPVQFIGNSDIKPKLKLNLGTEENPKYAEYISGNKEAVHVFKYTVVTGDNTSELDVTGITTTGITWVDVSDVNTKVENIAIPVVEANQLKGNRDIVIDTKAPTVSSFEASSASGNYNLGKQLYFAVSFSEEVNITNLSNEKVQLEFNNGQYSSEVTKTGPSSLLFKYVVTAGHDTSALKATNIVFKNVTVKDNAGNELELKENKIAVSDESKTYNIDTVAPAKPEISLSDGVTSDTPVYEDSVTFTITGFETAAGTQKKYKVDSGSWNDYTGAVTISSNGNHTVYAYQIDAAGNPGEYADTVTFTLDSGNVLTNVTADKPNGTYTVKGTEETPVKDVINIELVFRKQVTIENGKIIVNVENGATKNKELTCSDGATKSTSHKFAYTVEKGDSCSALNTVVDTGNVILTGTVKDANGKVIPAKYYTNPAGHTLADNRNGIKVVTDRPTVTKVELTGTTLTITYSDEVVKGTGKNIVITHGEGYKAPAVLTPELYKKYYVTNSDIKNYYEPGTNGSDANGVSDLTEKYILKYDYDVTDTTVISALETAGAKEVVVPVNSSYVTVSGKVVSIRLEDSYALPVKGATYSVNIAEGLVSDKLSHTSVADASNTITSAGVEAPVIRIQKEDETIDVSEKTVTQPTTAGVKIDCQTPGIQRDAGLTWTVKSQTNNKVTKAKGTAITQSRLNLTTDNTLSSTNTATPFNLGLTTDLDKGYIYQITAVATKSGVSQTAYEYAYRTVYSVSNTDKALGQVGSTYTQFWVRGGDDNNGGNNTAGFPISWNTSEFDKVRAMTKKDNSNTWYWITWKVNTKCYPQPLRGDLPSDAISNGPSVWCWGMQGPIPEGLDTFILYPGQSMAIDANVDYKYGNMSFYDKHCEYRDDNGNVVKAKK